MALAFIFMSANAVFSKPVLNSAVKPVLVKYGFAMLGIFVATFVLYLGLSLYNKFFVSSRINDCNLNSDSLRPPKDKEDAVLTFITKNRLN